MEFKKIVWNVTITLVILSMVILTIITGWTIYDSFIIKEKGGKEMINSNHSTPPISNGTLQSKSNSKKGLLERILKPEIIKIEGGNCVTYATYYNKTLKEKFPDLVIRWPKYVDICNNLTLCDNYHTFLIVAGYGGECILDQRHLACVDLLKTNLTKEEVDDLE